MTKFRALKSGFKLLFSVALIFSGQLSAADDEDFPVPALATENLDANSVLRVCDLEQENGKMMWLVLRLRIDELHRTVGLSESQRENLIVAAKGAVEHRLTELLEPLIIQLAGEAADQRSRIIDDANLEEQVMSVESDVLWEKVVGRVLSPEQQRQWAKQKDSRRARRRIAQINYLVDEIIHSLELDPSQRDKLAERVAKVFDQPGIQERLCLDNPASFNADSAVEDVREKISLDDLKFDWNSTRRQSQINYALGELDEVLRLDARQKERFLVLLSQAYDNPELQKELGRKASAPNHAERLVECLLEKIPRDELKKFLSDVQMSILE